MENFQSTQNNSSEILSQISKFESPIAKQVILQSLKQYFTNPDSQESKEIPSSAAVIVRHVIVRANSGEWLPNKNQLLQERPDLKRVIDFLFDEELGGVLKEGELIFSPGYQTCLEETLQKLNNESLN